MHTMASFEIYPVTGESRCVSSLISIYLQLFVSVANDDFHVRKIPELKSTHSDDVNLLT